MKADRFLCHVIILLAVFLIPMTAFPSQGSSTGSHPVPTSVKTGDTVNNQMMTDIHDIRALASMGMDGKWWRYAGVAAVLLVLAAIILYILKQRKKRSEIKTMVPVLAPEDVANQRLSEISDIKTQDGRIFYFRLSEIMRQYVEGRYNIGASEMTTEEFLPKVDDMAIDPGMKSRLKSLCRDSDPIKFAGALAVEKKMEEDLFFVKEFVFKTTPVLEKGNESTDSHS